MKNISKIVSLTVKGILLSVGFLFFDSSASFAQSKAVFVDMNRHVIRPADSLASSRGTADKSRSNKTAKLNTLRTASKDTSSLIKPAALDSTAYFRKWKSNLRPAPKH